MGEVRLRGPAGAVFVVSPGRPFSQEYIDAQIASGQWVPVDDRPQRRVPVSRRPSKQQD